MGIRETFLVNENDELINPATEETLEIIASGITGEQKTKILDKDGNEIGSTDVAGVRALNIAIKEGDIEIDVVGLKDSLEARINPAKEDGNLATLAGKDFAIETGGNLAGIKTDTAKLDVALSTRALETGGNLAGIKTDTGVVRYLAGSKLDVALSTRALETGGNLEAVKTAVEIMDDWDETDRAKVNVNLNSGVAVDIGAGNAGVGTQRVSIASDDVNVKGIKDRLEAWNDGVDKAKVNISDASIRVPMDDQSIFRDFQVIYSQAISGNIGNGLSITPFIYDAETLQHMILTVLAGANGTLTVDYARNLAITEAVYTKIYAVVGGTPFELERNLPKQYVRISFTDTSVGGGTLDIDAVFTPK